MVITKLKYITDKKIELHPVKNSNYNYQEFCLGIYKSTSTKYDMGWKWRTEDIIIINKPPGLSDGTYYLCMIFENALVTDYMFVKDEDFESLTTPYFLKINFAITITSDAIVSFDDTTVIGNIATSSGGRRSSTIVIAASNSSTEGKSSADYVCDGTNDNVEINSAISTLNTAGTGGKITLLEGTYEIGSPILLESNITIEGQGDGTILKRKSSTTTNIFQEASLSRTNILLKDFLVEGDKGNQTVSSTSFNFTSGSKITSQNIKLNNCYGDGFKYVYKGVNLECNTGVGIGFDHSYRLTNCMAIGNTGNGFEDCDQLNNCYASKNGGHGFVSCYRLASCKAEGNTNAGFHTCWVISSSLSYDNNNGFYECRMVTGCWGYDNSTDGFNGCRVVTGCYSNNNTNGMRNIDYGSCILTVSNTSNNWIGTNTKIDNDSSS